MEQIRNQYSIAYIPGDANGNSQHQIRVLANGRRNDLTVGAVRHSSGAVPPAPQ